MASNTTTKVKFYVQVVQDCPHCDGEGSLFGEQCPDCKGTGTQEDAMDLTAALQALGILTRLE